MKIKESVVLFLAISLSTVYGRLPKMLQGGKLLIQPYLQDAEPKISIKNYVDIGGRGKAL